MLTTSEEERIDKINSMFKNVEHTILMTVDTQQDAIYLASLLLTTAKTILLTNLGPKKTAEIMEMVKTL